MGETVVTSTESCRNGDRVAREAAAMPHRVSCPAFVGRAEELDVVDATLARVAAGRAATVLVAGDAGIGKTRLVDELGERARAARALVATGVCVPIDGGGLPYGPIVGILRDLLRQSSDAAVSELLGPLAAGLGLGPPGPARAARYAPSRNVADELAKTRRFESVLSCFTALAEQSVIVLGLEDLQWADSASAELLGFLTRNLADSRVLLVGTYRSDEVGRDHRLRPWLSELSRHGRVVHLRLEGLDRGEMATMIAGILGHQPDWTLVEAVWARSQGNPFFAEELTAARHQPSLSPELKGVIMHRVDRLAPEARLLLRGAATAGTIADHQLLDALGLLDADALDRALAETIDKQILVVDPGQAAYRFRHELLREVVYDAMLPGERRRLHRMMAVALTANPGLAIDGPGHRAGALAVHWWCAGEWERAMEASLVAADAASAVWAFPEAHGHLERALSALDRMPVESMPAADRFRLLEMAADVAYLAGAGPRSVELARQAIDDAGTSMDPARLGRCYMLLGRNAWAVGDSEAAFVAYRQATALVPTDRPSIELAQVLAEEARGLMLMSRFTEADRRCHDALAVATAVGARTEEGQILCTLGCCRAALGEHEGGIELMRQAVAIAEELADPDALDRAYANLGHLYLESGRLAEAAALVFDTALPGDELWGVRQNGAAANSVEALIRMGRYDDAETLLARSGERGVGSCITAPSLLRAMVLIRRGRFDDATRALAISDEVTARLTDVQGRGAFHVRNAELALAQGRPSDAYEDVERALALAAGTDDETLRPEMYAMAVCSLADQLDEAQARGRRFDADKARLLASGFLQEARRIVTGGSERSGTCAPRARAFAATCAAERTRLDTSDPDRWAEAAGEWDVAGEPHPAAYCRWREAEALLERRTGRARADECLQQAWRTSVSLGASPLQERIERLAQRARIALRDAPEATASTVATDLGLTPREVEVLGQLAAGRTDREIADALFISKKTVSVHVSNLLRKLEVTNRVEAGRIGQAHGCPANG